MANGPASLNGLIFAAYPTLFLPIANRPLADYLAAVLGASGIERVIIVSNTDSGQETEKWLDRLRASGLEADWVVQATLRGTGGTLKEVESFIHDESFWVVSGALLLGGDLAGMLSFHRHHGSLATVGAVRTQEPIWHMERVEAEDGGSVKTIHRIHPAQNRRSTLRPVGLYLFERAVLDLIPPDGYFDLKEQLFSELHTQGAPAHVWEINEYCRTITSVEDYVAANRDVLFKQSDFPVVGFSQLHDASYLPESRQISSSVTLLDPVALGAHTQIGDGAVIVGPTSIGDRCTIGARAVLINCTVFPGARVGDGANLHGCVVGAEASVEAGTTLREMIILSDSYDMASVGVSPCGQFTAFGLKLSGAQNTTRVTGRYYLWKRVLDVIFSAILLILAAPFMALIAIAVKLDSPGRAIFGQRRSTWGGREFNMYKFRSMLENAEEVKQTIQHLNEVDGPMFKITDDPRVTRLGRLLRKTNLDELPQLWNVLKGDMSLVGPRPLSMDEMNFNPRWRDLRLSVRPGLTGLWQVESHSKASFADWIRYDAEYIHRCSPRVDGMILFKTVGKTLKESLRSVRLRHREE
jgi:lipopolysaccharide/colanic/teichoic acid biosynthesis glycosyltransferase/carbonic anhydrase/acetyltransferase-like protein (isoleucine patch superfamily)